ncbi:MAG: hypothetical protein AAF567_22820 [Actinomycetota bacterium]
MTGAESSEAASPETPGVTRGEWAGFHVVDPDLYDRYRDQVLELGNSHQRNINEFLPADRRGRAWTDAEIAEHLGLDVRDVTEIRVVAEHDKYGIEEYEHSARFKDAASASYRERGVRGLYEGEPAPPMRGRSESSED